MNDWNIQARAHACQPCGKGFSDRQPYHTVLFDAKHEVQRVDMCEACWKHREGDGARDRKGFISHWQGVYEVPPPAAPEAIRKENAETLLRKIMELNDPKYMAASYILAVMLERKRILKVKEQFHREGQRVFVYEQPRTADVFTIPDPGLQLNQLEQVQREVAALLEHGSLTPPPPPEVSSTSAVSPTEGDPTEGDPTEGDPIQATPAEATPGAETPPTSPTGEASPLSAEMEPLAR
jgi:hypothetical protein